MILFAQLSYSQLFGLVDLSVFFFSHSLNTQTPKEWKLFIFGLASSLSLSHSD